MLAAPEIDVPEIYKYTHVILSIGIAHISLEHNIKTKNH